jgi:60 kDa SS-A/Ro ribonucleoprotein
MLGNSPSFADILKIAHPRPDTPAKEAMFGWMLGREYNREALPGLIAQFEAYKATRSGDLPAVPFEMLTALDLDTRGWAEIARKARCWARFCSAAES